MDMLEKMNQAVDYIEDHLMENISEKELAKIHLSSGYHFKRMFTFLAGVSVSEYIRRRRLSLAALELQKNNLRVIDIAVKYGYTSADSFTRAFFQQHGILPSKVRQQDTSIVTYPRIAFHFTIQGGEAMNVRIVEKEHFKIVGTMKRVSIVFEGVNPEIAAMAEQLTEKDYETLKGFSTIEPYGIINASTNFSEGRMEEQGELDHYIGVVAPIETETKYDELTVESGTWAVFEAIGSFPEALQDVWGRIYSEWFPTSGYEAIDGPEILWTESADTENPNVKSEIWISVEQKK
jgi:AraC family transcriptional regulator